MKPGICVCTYREGREGGRDGREGGMGGREGAEGGKEGRRRYSMHAQTVYTRPLF